MIDSHRVPRGILIISFGFLGVIELIVRVLLVLLLVVSVFGIVLAVIAEDRISPLLHCYCLTVVDRLLN